MTCMTDTINIVSMLYYKIFGHGVATYMIWWVGLLGCHLGATLEIVLCPDPTHSNEEKGLVFFEQFWGLSSEFWEANQNRSM